MKTGGLVLTLRESEEFTIGESISVSISKVYLSKGKIQIRVRINAPKDFTISRAGHSYGKSSDQLEQTQNGPNE